MQINFNQSKLHSSKRENSTTHLLDNTTSDTRSK